MEEEEEQDVVTANDPDSMVRQTKVPGAGNVLSTVFVAM